MTCLIKLNPRPWQAIKAGRKKIEVRTNVPGDSVDYGKVGTGDRLVFENLLTGEKLKTKVVASRHYADPRSLLVAEGTKRTLSSGKGVDDGVESILNHWGYRKAINRYGVWAIEVGVE